jgi:hypothetical protein
MKEKTIDNERGTLATRVLKANRQAHQDGKAFLNPCSAWIRASIYE